FQAEDGIRVATVTGFKTCALPICAVLKTLHSHCAARRPCRASDQGHCPARPPCGTVRVKGFQHGTRKLTQHLKERQDGLEGERGACCAVSPSRRQIQPRVAAFSWTGMPGTGLKSTQARSLRSWLG